MRRKVNGECNEKCKIQNVKPFVPIFSNLSASFKNRKLLNFTFCILNLKIISKIISLILLNTLALLFINIFLHA